MTYRIVPLILALVLAGGLAYAQDREEPTRERKTVEREVATETAETKTDAEAPEGEAKSGFSAVFERMRRAAGLPRAAEDAREAGVEEEQVREVIRVARERRIPADETREILEVETEEVRQGGDPRNFGAVVQELKASGLRGRELAEAIHAEQIARGMKKPKHRDHPGRGHGKGKPHGKDDDDSSDDDSSDEDEEGREKGKGRGKEKSGKKTRGN
jgi:hypothetical protein